jgi:hypothetical protein
MRRASFPTVLPLFAVVIILFSGCSSRGSKRVRNPGSAVRPNSGPVLKPLSKEDAIRLVNHNIAQLNGTVRATGSVDGYFMSPKSQRRFVNYSVDGTLFFMPPYYLRFDMKKLGDRQALFGSNDQYYWAYTKDDNAFTCGDVGGENPDLPVRPNQIIEALGMTPIPGDGSGAKMSVQADYQNVVMGNKEYWLDRRAPRLIRKLIFRNRDGSVAMTSDLSDYRAMPGGPYLPHLVNAEWPDRNARLRFDIGRWTMTPDVGPGGPQFATPPECLRGGGGAGAN